MLYFSLLDGKLVAFTHQNPEKGERVLSPLRIKMGKVASDLKISDVQRSRSQSLDDKVAGSSRTTNIYINEALLDAKESKPIVDGIAIQIIVGPQYLQDQVKDTDDKLSDQSPSPTLITLIPVAVEGDQILQIMKLFRIYNIGLYLREDFMGFVFTSFLEELGEQNPFVVRYVAAKKVENAIIVLMDFANYKSLDYVIEQKINLPPGTVRAILKQLLEGVRLMHKQGIVHGNITSENILLHSPSGSGRVILKITNIGLTKRPQVISYTNAKLIGGIFPNLAPEVIIGNGLIDSKIDVWSVGIIAHQLVAHEFPYKVQTFQQLQYQMRLQPIIKPASIKDDQLWYLLVNLLAFDPIDRFSAEQALNHSYFTGEQAEDDVTLQQIHLALNAQILQFFQEKTIAIYDITPSFIISQSDTQKVTGLDPDIENPNQLKNKNKRELLMK
ncbi:MAG: hypothetical protein EZS28_012203 [Streblomastix strix]|uniref:Protein kinase domain-containing protein n=1 Tax=Streblomastix strix TaxID=222440 RepID=A0A5J4WBS2_9EUKA|nr:MAG: hypothetical protein EZS28_012203 [Streblomastix strix]